MAQSNRHSIHFGFETLSPFPNITRRMTPNALLIASFLLYTFVFCANGIPSVQSENNNVIRTVTGREVTLDSLRQYGSRLKVSDPNVLLFDIDSDLRMQGQGLDIDLRAITGEPLTLSNAGITLVVNNKKVEFTDSDAAYMRKGDWYSVVHNRQGKVLGVWGPGLALSPVHTGRHPGVFINLAHRPYSPVTHDDGEEDDSFDPGEGRHFYGHDTEDVPDDVPEVTEQLESSRGVVHQAAGCAARTDTYAVSIATVSDRGMCAKYDDSATDTANVILAAMELTSTPYDRQTCLTLRTSYIELTCTDDVADPWAAMRNSDDIITTFRLTFTALRPDVTRDVAYFLPSYFDGTSTSGVAYVGTACRRSAAYGWVEDLEEIVIAHEIGHSLGCPHATSGLMKASWTDGDPLVFSSASVECISTFVDNIRAGAHNTVCLLDEATVPLFVPPLESPSPTISVTPSTTPSVTRSATPSPTPSTTVVPSISRTPSPSATPPRTAESCTSTFSESAAFICDTLYSTDVTTSSETLRYRVRQRSNGILVDIQARTKGLIIVGAAMSVRMASVGPDVPPENLETPRKRASVFVSMDDIPVEQDQNTCCDRTMSIQVAVYMCGQNRCRTMRIRLTRSMRCKQCLRRYSSATALRTCTKCRN